MSIPFSGTRSRSKGVISAIAKHLRKLSLKPVKSISIKFDPFGDNALQTRDFFFHITTPKIIATNPRCSVKPQIVSDLSEPLVTFKLLSGDSVVIKSTNLTSLNILELYNKHITPLSPPDPETESEIPAEEKKKKKRGKLRLKRWSKNRGVFL
ncbi:PREDICTED: 39S ribosomal protein L53, mitochondrial [Dufourea novaeangliae]|uniref:Large ribosomal subunit protein mL53 n=1 Tax=Dufourea novaeangliae TaxID=178035 RepID=A0A154PI56_DUFNO|nr:PREDICTED: 39S ribosomal protein L53, mitochondrial [Dufourea novaeangliae]KZC11541.1 39S ribosomal protein L53, mitochondrial [Dufourea novaeangliae]